MLGTFLSNFLAVGEDLPFDSPTTVFFTIVVVIMMIGLSVLLVFRIRKDLINSRNSSAEKGMLPFNKFKMYVDSLCKQKTKKLKYALFRVDIRHLNSIKKAIGEEQLEFVYTEMASQIAKLAPWGIRVARFNEKSIYATININEERTVENMCQLIINNLAKNYEIGAELSIQVMINVTACDIPEAGKNMEELMSALDISMVQAKRRGENSFILYNVKYVNENTEEYKYYHEIKQAIANKEFILHYQPVINIDDLKVVSAEAVMRWAHKTRGILPPSEFLDIMEQTGDINWVGFWCFDQMLSQFTSWQSNYEQKFTISCNLSERQLLNPDLADELKKYIRKYKIDPANIMFEMADLTMYNMSSVVKNNVDKLAQFGVKICYDSFGSKSSALTTLQDFPLNTIKLFKGFWSKINESTIIKDSIGILVDYAKQNNIMLIAVGVEDRDEIDMLKANGVQYMQGFAFAKQKDPKDFIADVVFRPWSDILSEKPVKKAEKETEKEDNETEKTDNKDQKEDKPLDEAQGDEPKLNSEKEAENTETSEEKDETENSK